MRFRFNKKCNWLPEKYHIIMFVRNKIGLMDLKSIKNNSQTSALETSDACECLAVTHDVQQVSLIK